MFLSRLAADTNQDGKISREEWLRKFGSGDGYDVQMVQMFDVYDADGSGFIDAEEFRSRWQGPETGVAEGGRTGAAASGTFCSSMRRRNISKQHLDKIHSTCNEVWTSLLF